MPRVKASKRKAIKARDIGVKLANPIDENSDEDDIPKYCKGIHLSRIQYIPIGKLSDETLTIRNNHLFTHSNTVSIQNNQQYCEHCNKLYRNNLRKYQTAAAKNHSKLVKLFKEKRNILKKVNRQIHRIEDLKNRDDKIVISLRKLLHQKLLTPNDFFYKLIENTTTNAHKQPNQFRHSPEIIEWALNLKYYGGRRCYDFLRGYNVDDDNEHSEKEEKQNLQQYNMILPSISTLKEYLPELMLNWIQLEALTEILEQMKNDSGMHCDDNFG